MADSGPEETGGLQGSGYSLCSDAGNNGSKGRTGDSPNTITATTIPLLEYFRPSHKILLTTRHALLGKVRYLVERHVKGLDFEPAFHFIRSLGHDVIEEASDDELRPIVEVTEGNPLLIKLFVTRLLTSHLPLAFVLAELQAVNQRLGRNIIDYLYAESLSVLEQYCGSDAAHWILNAFCPLGAGDNVSYETLRTYSGIEDEEMFRNTLRVACDLSLIRTSKLNSLYSIHSLLWKFVCEN